MNTFRVFAILALLSASGANAAEQPVPSGRFAKERVVVQITEDELKNLDTWIKLCFDVPNAGTEDKGGPAQKVTGKERAEACYTYSTISDYPETPPASLLGILQTKAPSRNFLIILLPVVPVLPDDLGYLQLDGSERIKVEHLAGGTCDRSGCYLRAEMTQELLDRMKTAKAISLRAPDSTVSPAPLPCCGFGAVLDGAPVPAEAQDETQRKIQEVIRRRFADFTR